MARGSHGTALWADVPVKNWTKRPLTDWATSLDGPAGSNAGTSSALTSKLCAQAYIRRWRIRIQSTRTCERATRCTPSCGQAGSPQHATAWEAETRPQISGQVVNNRVLLYEKGDPNKWNFSTFSEVVNNGPKSVSSIEARKTACGFVKERACGGKGAGVSKRRHPLRNRLRCRLVHAMGRVRH